MILEVHTSGPCDTNAYVVGCSATRSAFLIDAPPESAEWVQKTLAAKKLKLEKIFLTHSHWDHIGDVALLRDWSKAEVFVHAQDAENLKNPGADGLPLFFPIQGVVANSFLEEGNLFTVGELSFEIFWTPGHSPGSICLYLEKEKILFSGDTVFAGAMGRVDFPTSSPSDMKSSLQRLSRLPHDIKVYAGHGPMTYIGKELWMAQPEKRFFELK
jgi:hydroxyacylglutathione hydrolase